MDFGSVFCVCYVSLSVMLIGGMILHMNCIGLPAIDKKYDVQSLRDNDGMEAYYDKRYEERKRAAWEKRHGRT